MFARLRALVHNQEFREWTSLGLLAAFLLTSRLNRSVQSRVYIQGAGNSGNRITLEGLADELATLLAQREDCPQITDDELIVIMKALRERALAGDSQAALVVFRLAEIQRQAAQTNGAPPK